MLELAHAEANLKCQPPLWILQHTMVKIYTHNTTRKLFHDNKQEALILTTFFKLKSSKVRLTAISSTIASWPFPDIPALLEILDTQSRDSFRSFHVILTLSQSLVSWVTLHDNTRDKSVHQMSVWNQPKSVSSMVNGLHLWVMHFQSSDALCLSQNKSIQCPL